MAQSALFVMRTSLLSLKLSYPPPETLQLGFSACFGSLILLRSLRLGLEKWALSRVGRLTRRLPRPVSVVARCISCFSVNRGYCILSVRKFGLPSSVGVCGCCFAGEATGSSTFFPLREGLDEANLSNLAGVGALNWACRG